MGFYYNAISLPKSIPAVTFLLTILTHTRFLFTAALTHLGLHKPPPAPEVENDDPYILIPNGSSPTLVPTPVRVVTAAIKARVPVLQYRDSLRRQGVEEKTAGCSICLESIEWMDEIRELASCSHPFHRACLDSWIDAGQVNCPLCRTMLLPPKLNPLLRCADH